MDGNFSDLQKSFECVNQEISLSKLEYYGVTGKAKLWFKYYLKNRYQWVLITEANHS